jgi:hypothetical protein
MYECVTVPDRNGILLDEATTRIFVWLWCGFGLSDFAVGFGRVAWSSEKSQNHKTIILVNIKITIIFEFENMMQYSAFLAEKDFVTENFKISP